MNRAEVDIPVDASDIGQFSPPPQLYLVGVNDTASSGNYGIYQLLDQGTVFYAGTYDAFNKMYVFDIADYVQRILDKKALDGGLFLDTYPMAAYERVYSLEAERVVGYGGKGIGPASNQHMRLKLYYTPLKS